MKASACKDGTTIPEPPGKNWCILALSSEGEEYDPLTGMFRVTEESHLTLRVVLTRKALRTIFSDNDIRTVFYLAVRKSVQRLLADTPLVFDYT